MANNKSEKNGKQGNNGQKGNKGGSIKGAECALTSSARREAIRKEEARLEEARHALKATGEFFLKQNDGRENDIFKLEAGVIGEYAIPGGNKPSVHVHVAEMGTPEKPLRVIYFDQAHEGSGLPGNLNTETYLPVWALSKDSFTPKMDGHRGETQSKMFSFLTGAIDDTRVQMAKNQEERMLTEKLAKADKDLRGIKRGQLGDYLVMKGDKVAVIRVFMAKHVSVSVPYSTIPELPAMIGFLPLQQFNFTDLRQVTTDAIYKAQLAIHSFLKPILDALVDDEPAEVVKQSLHVVTTKPVVAPLAPSAKKEVATVSVLMAMKGSTGVAVFEADEQSLTLNIHDKVSPKGTIRFFEVIGKSGFTENSVFPIEVGTFVTAEQLIAQAISKADVAALPPKSSGAKIALIAFIMKAVKGVRFCKKPSDAILPKATGLRLVA